MRRGGGEEGSEEGGSVSWITLGRGVSVMGSCGGDPGKGTQRGTSPRRNSPRWTLRNLRFLLLH